MGKWTPHVNQDTTVLARCSDNCAECGAQIPAGEFLCPGCL